MDEKTKQELLFLQKEYEIISKSHDETQKLFFTIPVFALALIAVAVPKELINKLYEPYLLILAIAAINIIGVFWGWILRDLESFKNYRRNIENRVNNEYFKKEVIGFETRNKKQYAKNTLTRYLLLFFNIIALAVFAYFTATYNDYLYSYSSLLGLIFFLFWWIIFNKMNISARRSREVNLLEPRC